MPRVLQNAKPCGITIGGLVLEVIGASGQGGEYYLKDKPPVVKRRLSQPPNSTEGVPSGPPGGIARGIPMVMLCRACKALETL